MIEVTSRLPLRAGLLCCALSLLTLFAACGDDDAEVDSDQAPMSSDVAGSRVRDASALDAAARDGALPRRGDGGRDAAPSAAVDAGSPITITHNGDCPKDAPLAVDRVRLYPAKGGGANLDGVRIQGSNEGTTVGFVDLATLEQAPPDAKYTELKFENDVVYRYVRFFDPQGRKAPLAELEFYHGAQKLSGKDFGTVGSTAHPAEHALDGDTATYFVGQTAGGNYVGLDIAGDYVAAAPTFSPAAGALSGATKITLSTDTPNAVIHYTTDGTPPTVDSPVYAGPIEAGATRVMLSAISIAPCYFASAVATATYGRAGEPVGVGQKSYHLGNSLTDTIDGFLEPIADSTGVDHQFARWTIPGCQISWQASPAHVDQGTAIPDEARHVSSFVHSFQPDQVTVQPFTDPTIANEGPAALTFLQPAVDANPNVQTWVYAQWPSTSPTLPENEGRGYLDDELARGASWASWPAPVQPVPDTWEDTTDARMRYYEAFADYVDQRLPGKPVLIVPGGPALATLKRRVDAGTVPGITDFFGQVFAQNDDLHLRNSGRYLVALVFYACFYRQNPEDAVRYIPDEVTPQQAKVLKQIAWETASNYPRCGIAQ